MILCSIIFLTCIGWNIKTKRKSYIQFPQTNTIWKGWTPDPIIPNEHTHWQIPVTGSNSSLQRAPGWGWTAYVKIEHSTYNWKHTDQNVNVCHVYCAEAGWRITAQCYHHWERLHHILILFPSPYPISFILRRQESSSPSLTNLWNDCGLCSDVSRVELALIW